MKECKTCKVNKVYLENIADFSDTKYRGESYVYVWVDSNGNPFYVGSGTGKRAFTVGGHTNNLRFKERCTQTCDVYIVAKNISRVGVFDVERQTIRHMVANNVELAQKAYTNLFDKYGSMIPVSLIVERCAPIWQTICSITV